MPLRGVPDRWLDYSPMGEVIQGTRIICMKVPLKPSLLASVPDEEKFSCEDAIDMASCKGHKIGLVVDLTFTKKYYNPALFENENISYKKIFMPGRVIPEKSIMDDFYNTVEEYEALNCDNDNLVVVHCTHGLNRTGYMVCRYLIDKKGFSSSAAIAAFENARGHKIEREIYLDDLQGKVTHDTAPANSQWRRDQYYGTQKMSKRKHQDRHRLSNYHDQNYKSHDTRRSGQWRQPHSNHWDNSYFSPADYQQRNWHWPRSNQRGIGGAYQSQAPPRRFSRPGQMDSPLYGNWRDAQQQYNYGHGYQRSRNSNPPY